MIDNEARIKVVGVGGGGGNAVSYMASERIKNIDFISVNTDAQALIKNKSPIKFTIGEKLTKGLGVGGDPEKGRAAAQESAEYIAQHLSDADMIFITAGMGGGTGTGAAPEIARIAREKNKDVLIVGVVTKPFTYEGEAKSRIAEIGIEEMKKYTDSMIVIPNSKILECFLPESRLSDAFAGPNDVLKRAIRGITDIINTPGDMNVDFQDIKSIMKNSQNALIGIGKSSDEQRHMKAIQEALRSPLLENSNIEDATGLIVHISAGRENFKLFEFDEIADYVKKAVSNDDVKIKFGKVYMEENDADKGVLSVTVIATGFSSLPFPANLYRPLRRDLEPDLNPLRNENFMKPPVNRLRGRQRLLD